MKVVSVLLAAVLFFFNGVARAAEEYEDGYDFSKYFNLDAVKDGDILQNGDKVCVGFEKGSMGILTDVALYSYTGNKFKGDDLLHELTVYRDGAACGFVTGKGPNTGELADIALALRQGKQLFVSDGQYIAQVNMSEKQKEAFLSGKQAGVFVRLTDELYKEFKEGSYLFSQADEKLNTTWALLRKNLPKQEFDKVRKEQSLWASQGRDEAANAYARDMSLEEAFVRATNDRTLELAKLLAKEPEQAVYTYLSESDEGSMKIQRANGVLFASINTVSKDGRGTCEFEGKLIDQDNDGWYETEMEDDGIAVFFLKKEAHLLDFGLSLCGVYAHMGGKYQIKR